MNSWMYDDGDQEECMPELPSTYTSEQEYWEEYDQIHAMRDRRMI